MAVDGPVGKMGNISTPDVLPFELDRKVKENNCQIK
jgi:hypothetical protein